MRLIQLNKGIHGNGAKHRGGLNVKLCQRVCRIFSKKAFLIIEEGNFSKIISGTSTNPPKCAVSRTPTSLSEKGCPVRAPRNPYRLMSLFTEHRLDGAKCDQQDEPMIFGQKKMSFVCLLPAFTYRSQIFELISTRHLAHDPYDLSHIEMCRAAIKNRQIAQSYGLKNLSDNNRNGVASTRDHTKHLIQSIPIEKHFPAAFHAELRGVSKDAIVRWFQVNPKQRGGES